VSEQPFQLCLNPSTIKCGGIDLEEQIDVTSDAGYAGIEPWIRDIDAYVEAGGRLGELRSRFEDAGLAVVNLIGFFEWAVEDEARRNASFEEARRSFSIAQSLGCRYVAAPPFGATETRQVDLLPLAERYADVVAVGREFDVVPLLEYWGHSMTLQRPGEALMVLAESGCPEGRILADVFHSHKGGGHPSAFRLLGPASLGVLHINDYPESADPASLTDADRVYPGDGVAPLAQTLHDLHAAGYDGPLSLELFNETYWAQEPATVARTGMAKLAAVIEAALG